MEPLFDAAARLARPALRLSLGLVLGWIGALKFVDPQPVVDLLAASFAFLAATPVAYLLGVAEVAAAALLLAGVAERWAGLLCLGLFAGTLTIFVIAPAVSFGAAGFPRLTLAGEFLLKDAVLFAAALAVIALATEPQRRAAAAR
jgi:uncharacterized membrane protein YkgB